MTSSAGGGAPAPIGVAPSAAAVRDASSGDALRLAEVQVRSWRVAYRDVFPASFLEGLDVEGRRRRREARLDRMPERWATLVVEEHAVVQGYADVGPADGEGETGELYAIYLDPERYRRGLGSVLLDAAEARLASLGFARAVLWVLEENRSARSFYETRRWIPEDVLRLEEIGGRQVVERRYGKELRSQAPDFQAGARSSATKRSST